MKKLDPAVAESLTAAVRDLEKRSCAEVVVEIRSRSGSYAQADARFASLLALVALIVLLFSPWPFRAGWVVVDVIAAWIFGYVASYKSGSIRHLMTTRKERERQVRTVAAAAFHDRGVANTMRESGVLVYFSELERRIELLADRGVLQSVPSMEWNRLAESTRARRAGTAELLGLVRALAPLLECYLPWQEGDVDELCNVPQFVVE